VAEKLSQYYKEVEKALYLFETTLNTLENKILNLPDEDVDLVENDYSGAVYAVQNAVNKLMILDNIHKFEKITKSQMQYLFSSYDSGNGINKIVTDIEYIVATYDTIRTIEQKFNVPWLKIQDYNNILPSEVVTGLAIRIPIETPVDQNTIRDIPTIGDQQGNNILGVDFTNDLKEGEDGDFKTLTPEESFKQSVDNRLTLMPGSVPYYEEIGFDPKIPEGYNNEEIESILQLRIINALSDDKRIKNISISDQTKNKTSRQFSTNIQTISGQQIELPI
jgi:hypothetical protein